MVIYANSCHSISKPSTMMYSACRSLDWDFIGRVLAEFVAPLILNTCTGGLRILRFSISALVKS